MALKLITPPAGLPVSLADAKAHLRVSHSDDDDLITSLIDAVRLHVEGEDGFLQRALVTQTWELQLDQFPGHCGWRYQGVGSGEIRVPLPPLQSVVSVKYDDTNGDEQTLGVSEYTVDAVNQPGWLLPGASGWPSTFHGINAVRIRFVAGYPATEDSPPSLTANIPAPIRAAIKLMVGTLYENRESVIVGSSASAITLPWAAEQLLFPYRIF